MADRYRSNPNNSFFAVEDDDVDDDTFLRNSRQEQRLKAFEDRALKSTQASINLLRDSEEVGVRTAEELLVQREKLERTEKNLDDINSTLRNSQKHINGIKSVFGSLRNYLSGRQDQKRPAETSTETSGSSSSYSASASNKLTTVLESSTSSGGVHPSLRIRGLVEEEEPSKTVGDNSFQSRYRQVNDKIDQNLEEVGSSLSRLKGLAEGLGEEIESQNDLLDRINNKTDRADITLKRQNREMNRILK